MSRPADFWARRRAGVQAEARVEEAERAALAEAEMQAAQAEKTDEELLAEFDLPDPDSLKLGDDIRGFMAKAVPDHLRRRALRQLWRLNPVLANVDGLVDYGGDFTDKATVVENLQSAYQVGKGMLKHVEEMARQAEAKAAGAAETHTSPEPEPEPELAAAPMEPETATMQPDTAEVDAGEAKPEIETTQAEPIDYAPPRPRRMQFTFSSPETA